MTEHDAPSAGETHAEHDTEPPAPAGKIVLWQNTITITGIYIASLGLMLLLTFGLFSIVSPASNTYVDIFGYLVVPVIMAFGVALVPLGILVKSWRIRRHDPTQRLQLNLPRFDLNDPQQRRVAKFVVLGIFMLMPILGVASYHGYHYTDSVDFCANACHAVMEPQGSASTRSSHARVACAECHIGTGASWFVKSKLSGTRQVIAVTFDTYHRPIPPAIRHLRPARDTCEHCHWPAKFFGSQLRTITHYGSDAENTPHQVQMLVKIGGTEHAASRGEGIHAHMLELGTVEFIAVDDTLQDVPWVRWTDSDGKVHVFRSDGLPGTAAPPEGRHREMDCIDCHNRPGHEFLSPSRAINRYLSAERLDSAMPFIKREAVKAMLGAYTDNDTAETGIRRSLEAFYREHYGDAYAEHEARLVAASEEVFAAYRANIFPYMRVDWRTYPNNIGHFESPGCYRCHDGKHVSDEGLVIGSDCDTCHTFLNTVDASGGNTYIAEGAFVHPYELPGVHNELRCDACHSGGVTPTPTCTGCHSREAGFMAGSWPAFERFGIEPDVMAGSVECADCHDVESPTTVDAVNALCVDCHDDDYDGMIATWADEFGTARTPLVRKIDQLARALQAAPETEFTGSRTWLTDTRATLRMLDGARPMHNHEAALTIIETLATEVDQHVAKVEKK